MKESCLSASDNISHITKIDKELLAIVFSDDLSLVQATKTMMLVCKKWAEVIQSDYYWQLLFDKYFPGMLLDKLIIGCSSNREIFKRYCHIFSVPVWSKSEQKVATSDALLTYIELFACIKRGDVNCFLKILSNKLIVVQVDTTESAEALLNGARREILRTLSRPINNTEINLFNWCISLGNSNFLPGLYQALINDQVCLSGHPFFNSFNLAVICQQTEVVNKMLNERSPVLSQQVQSPFHALTCAVIYNYEQISTLLNFYQSKKPDLITQNDKDQALSQAVSLNQLDTIKLFLQAGWPINGYDYSPLETAVKSSHYSTLVFLLENGADPKRVSDFHIDLTLIDENANDERNATNNFSDLAFGSSLFAVRSQTAQRSLEDRINDEKNNLVLLSADSEFQNSFNLTIKKS
jgi:hypothetical protein